VYEAGRVPRWNTIVELWQADDGGRFAHPNDPHASQADPHFMGWGRTWTNNDGYFEFFTVKPGAYLDPVSGAQRAPHINASFTGSGLMRRLVTTLFFPHEAGNAVDPVLAVIPDAALRARLMLKPAQASRAPAGVASYEIEIVLQGEGETPFFVD
jgi:protocatechuate 3,4-dioxygenase beta subunit